MRSLVGKYFTTLLSFRRKDLPEFAARHDRLYAEARRTNEHAAVTANYYSVMEPLIEAAYGSSWHFCPPDHPRQPREAATLSMHQRIARMIQLQPGRVVLDVGCGVGGAMRDMASFTGGRVTGISIGPNEIARNNALNAKLGLARLCQGVCGDAQLLPFDSESFDGGYAIYALKYFADVARVLGEVCRVLKPGGLFASYNIVRSASYDARNERQRKAVESFEYACAMPPLLTADELAAAGERCGMECVSVMDASRENACWDHYFVANPLLPLLVRATWIRRLVAMAERLRLLPPGFARFNDVFLSGTVSALLDAGREGAISGSNLIIWRKP